MENLLLLGAVGIPTVVASTGTVVSATTVVSSGTVVSGSVGTSTVVTSPGIVVGSSVTGGGCKIQFEKTFMLFKSWTNQGCSCWYGRFWNWVSMANCVGWTTASWCHNVETLSNVACRHQDRTSMVANILEEFPVQFMRTNIAVKIFTVQSAVGCMRQECRWSRVYCWACAYWLRSHIRKARQHRQNSQFPQHFFNFFYFLPQNFSKIPSIQKLTLSLVGRLQPLK